MKGFPAAFSSSAKTGLRLLSEEFTLTFNTAELAAATAGDYEATVYMTVEGV